MKFFGINLLTLRIKKIKNGNQNFEEIISQLKLEIDEKKKKDLEDQRPSADWHLVRNLQIFFLFQLGLFPLKLTLIPKSFLQKNLIF